MNWSNKNIFAILVVTLMITVVGTAVNMSKIYGFSYFGLTGAATSSDTGNATITISQSTSITNNFDTIQFGSGFVNSTCTVCYMDSNGVITAGCCGTFNRTNNKGFLLENTGNINLSVNYTCAGNCTGALFVGGGTNPKFELKATNNFAASQAGETSTADTVASCVGFQFAGYNFTTYKDISAGGDWLCGNSTNFPLDFTDTQDAFVVDLNVSVPVDAPTSSQKSAVFTFNALATG